jgi:putative acetyltransferase
VTLPTPSDARIAHEDPRSADGRTLVDELDRYLQGLYPAASNHPLDPETLAGPGVRFLVARSGDAALGCAALRLDAEAYGEIKRMYVRPVARGTGLGRQLLAALEAEGRRAALTCLRLETGIHQPEAIALYRAAGFQERGPFGIYRPDPLSLFMEKELAFG